MKHLLLGLFLFQLIACDSCAPPPTAVPPTPVPPDSVVDAGPTPPPAPPPLVVVDAVPPPQPDLAPGVREACLNITAIGCAEGGASCAGALQRAVAKRLTNVPLACLSAAGAKAAVRACGFVACP